MLEKKRPSKLGGGGGRISLGSSKQDDGGSLLRKNTPANFETQVNFQTCGEGENNDEAESLGNNMFGTGFANATLGGLSSSKKFESFRNDNLADDDDDFYDARGDEKTLQDMQAEM